MDVDKTRIKPLSKVCESPRLDSSEPILIEWNGLEFYAPATLSQAAEYKAKHPEARIFSGATDIGVQINKGKKAGTRLMSLHLIPELYDLKSDKEWVSVGARVTLDELQVFLEDKAPEFSEFLNIFASPQIKNAATLIGNVANGSPIGDTTPYLMTADAEVNLFGPKGERTLPLTDFITGYKTFNMEPSEFITSIRFKLLEEDSKAGLYKVSQRRDLDISCVNGSFIFVVDDNKIQSAKIAVGGVGPKTLRLHEAEKAAEGKVLDAETVRNIKSLMESGISPISDARGTAEFRTQITKDLFDKYVQEHF
jgi:xanthine dehydrogenase small subunit